MGQEGDLTAAPDVVNCLETELARLTDMLARHKEGVEIGELGLVFRTFRQAIVEKSYDPLATQKFLL